MSLIPPSVGPVPPQGPMGQNDLATEYRNTVIEIQSQLFDKTATYSNLIMVGGCVFTIWGNVRGQLPAKANILIALLLGFSLCVFIFYQIYKMSGHVSHFQRVRDLLREDITTQQFFDKYNKIDREARQSILKYGTLAFRFCFLSTVIPAVLALGLLFFNFTASLFGWQMWPQ